MFYILFGADDYSLKSRLAELKKGWGDVESLGMNTTLFEARHLTPGQLINACNSIPFMAANRLVIVDGLLGLFERKKESPPSSKKPARSDKSEFGEWEALVQYILGLPPSTQLVLIDGNVSKSNLLFKKLAPLSQVQEFPALKGAAVQQWIQSRVAGYGGKISPQAVKLLADLAGDNLWVLANELEKLYLYAGGRCIEEKDVLEITGYEREASVFAMVDAVVERRTSAAIQLLHQLLAGGSPPPYLLVMITRQIRMIVQSKDLIAQRVSPEEIRGELGLSPSYRMDRLIKQASGYSMPRLVDIYGKLMETDQAIKTGKWKGDLALDLLIAEVCL